jgi:hypothetical protein
MKRPFAKKGTLRHGQYQTAEYRAWLSMITRCENKKAANYHRYGARGISIFPAWRANFEAFLAYVGPRPSKQHSLDRIKVDGNYEPGNVRWATSTEQNCNRRDNFCVCYGGSEMSLSQAIRLSSSKVSRTQIRRRLSAGWSADDALDLPTSRSVPL